ncbi:hypothetical protein EYZ11_011857 [Aspergillus tanneri]|uniref:Uncharacterized protein n=1 Tax=Aspergillus tanneri TaxID=1220188 RepID=A0A4S3J1R4_9EURO|nr:hypothetical protein EYZ11_011857 [Aspergillus tanneri]
MPSQNSSYQPLTFQLSPLSQAHNATFPRLANPLTIDADPRTLKLKRNAICLELALNDILRAKEKCIKIEAGTLEDIVEVEARGPLHERIATPTQ